MLVLGISPLDKDATVSLVADGHVLFAAGEERFSRVKQQDGFPARAVEAALTYTGIRPREIDAVAYPFLKWEDERKLFRANLRQEHGWLRSRHANNLGTHIARALAKVPARSGSIDGLGSPNETMPKGLAHRIVYRAAARSPRFSTAMAMRGSRQWADEAEAAFRKWEAELEQGLARFGISASLRRMEHHLSHAANSYLASGYDRALCITLDGYGSGLSGSVSEARDGKIRRLHGVQYPSSLGTMYEHVTSSLGFRAGRHEGKIVGLAAYGDPQILTDILLGRIEQFEGDFRLHQANNIYFSRHLAALFPKIDVAAAYQHVLERVATNFVHHWVRKTGATSVVLSGGVTANVKLNQRIFEIPEVEQIFVYPNMGDGGCGTGAAMYFSCPAGVGEQIKEVYWGPDYQEAELVAVLEQAGLEYRRPPQLASEAARLINKGAVVARFDGRMEYGPRALGNRSVLYHAKEPEVNQWLNRRLGRTEFMPFAPVTLFEARHRFYRNVEGAEVAAQFMTITFDCTDEMKARCPAAVHVDGTARPQLIKRETNPDYYDIVHEYEKLTGVPCLINTSFNMHEEPIVNSPLDAVRAFMDGRLDFLILGPFLARNSGPKGQQW
jgi:carbamoyltransferase